MGDEEIISLRDRAALLARLREPLREQAQKRLDISAQFCAMSGDIESEMDILWLQSVTDGSESYKAYIVSPLWKRISEDILLRDNHRCRGCGREAEIVHHRRYDFDVMAGRNDSGLVSLCAPCHRYIHFHHQEKTSSSHWERRLRRLRKRSFLFRFS